jgi:hypothetical protein
VILNLKYGARPAAEVLEEIGTEVLPALAAAGNETIAALQQYRVAAAATSR